MAKDINSRLHNSDSRRMPPAPVARSTARQEVQREARRASRPSITYSDFELVFKGYTQPLTITVLRQVFVGVKEVSINDAAKTARVSFQEKGQAQVAYEATLGSETRTGIYDRVIAQYMPGASFDSMEEFSKALGEAISQQRQQRKGSRRKG